MVGLHIPGDAAGHTQIQDKTRDDEHARHVHPLVSCPAQHVIANKFANENCACKCQKFVDIHIRITVTAAIAVRISQNSGRVHTPDVHGRE